MDGSGCRYAFCTTEPRALRAAATKSPKRRFDKGVAILPDAIGRQSPNSNRRSIRRLPRFHHWRAPSRQFSPRLVNRLVMAAVDHGLRRLAQARPDGYPPRNSRRAAGRHGRRPRSKVRVSVRPRVGSFGTNVLEQGSFQVDIQDLAAIADSQHRLRRLEGVIQNG